MSARTAFVRVLIAGVVGCVVTVSCGTDDDDETSGTEGTGATTTANTTVGTAAPTSAPDSTTGTTPGTALPPDPLIVTAGDVSHRVTEEDPASRCFYRERELLVESTDDITELMQGTLLELGVPEEFVDDLPAPEEVLTDIDAPGATNIVRFILPPGVDPLLTASVLFSQGVDAAPNYTMALAPGWIFGPGEAPLPAGGKTDGEAPEIVTTDPVTVGVVDTGSLTAEQLATAGVTVASLNGPGDDVPVGYAAGHGSQITSMVGQLLPGATIEMEAAPFRDVAANENFEVPTANALPGGAATTTVSDDAAVAIALMARFRDNPVDVLNLSLGTYGCSANHYRPELDEDVSSEETVSFRVPIATRSALLHLHLSKTEEPDVPFVAAAAGNENTNEMFFPGAWAANPAFGGTECDASASTEPTAPDPTTLSDWLISVGSTPSTAGGEGAEGPSSAADPNNYSNFGCWVSVVADGSDIVGIGVNTAGEARWQSWSGTSFAAPCVAAHLAGGETLLEIIALGPSVPCGLTRR
jgi:hypothetical protein